MCSVWTRHCTYKMYYLHMTLYMFSAMYVELYKAYCLYRLWKFSMNQSVSHLINSSTNLGLENSVGKKIKQRIRDKVGVFLNIKKKFPFSVLLQSLLNPDVFCLSQLGTF
jgi:hypothetical protein